MQFIEPEDGSLFEERLNLILFDGEYSNKMDILRMHQPLIISESRREKLDDDTVVQTMQSCEITASLEHYDRMNLVSQIYDCSLNLELRKVTAGSNYTTSDEQYTIEFSNSKPGNGSQCLPPSTSITVEARSVDKDFAEEYASQVRSFCFYVSGAMIVFMFFYEKEMWKYDLIFRRIYFNSEWHGQPSGSYASKYSLWTNYSAFIVNANLLVLYFKLAIEGSNE